MVSPKFANVKYPKGKNYFYVQKRYTRYYYCKKCGVFLGYYYRGKWDFGHYLTWVRNPKNPKFKLHVVRVDRLFPDECPSCYIPFTDLSNCRLWEAINGACHG